MENKQTAVTELKAILKSQLVASIFERVEHFIDKAIILEREQIEEAFNKGYDDHEYSPTEMKYDADPDLYYTKTYSEPLKDKNNV